MTPDEVVQTAVQESDDNLSEPGSPVMKPSPEKSEGNERHPISYLNPTPLPQIAEAQFFQLAT